MSSSTELRAAEQRSLQLQDSVVLEMRDTLREVTTVTVQLDAVGDTVKVSTVTDRTRVANRDRVQDAKERVTVKVDTVYIATRDSIEIRSRPNGQSHFAGLSAILKWVFWIIIGLIVLVIVVRIRGRP